MRLLGEILGLAVEYLKDKKIENARFTAEVLLSHVLQKKRIDLYMQFECPLEEGELEQFRALLRRASLHEPVEYIIGSVEFYDCEFSLSSDVLIPRPETEILVDHIVKKMKKENLKEKVLLDLCSGSGCIGISLKKKFPDLKVFLSDQSEVALALSKKNAEKNKVEANFLLGDLLGPFFGEKADFVVCNPPYITEEDYKGLQPSVKVYEPKLALVGGETGLEFYARLAKDLPICLNPGAKVFFEIGSGQGEEVGQLFSSSFWKKTELLCDYAGHDRFFFLEIE